MMNKSSFLGKTASIQRLEAIDAVIWPQGEHADEYTVAEVYPSDFEGYPTDKYGRTAYSIDLYIDQAQRIVKIVRTGHLHMHGGQAYDDELNRFPHKTLEAEAQRLLAGIVA